MKNWVQVLAKEAQVLFFFHLKCQFWLLVLCQVQSRLSKLCMRVHHFVICPCGQAEMEVVGSGQQRVEAAGAGEQNVMEEEHKGGKRK